MRNISLYVYVEWQKRGLPQIHTLLWLKHKIKQGQIDSLISAEIPNLNVDSILFEIIKNNTVQGPSGQINPGSQRMSNGKCTRNYPKQLICET